MSVHRGRKPSGKPGAKHMAALQAAHGKDHKAAHRAALDYAKALTLHMKAGEPEGDIDDQPAAFSQSQPQPSAPKPDGRAQLAKLMMSRKK